MTEALTPRHKHSDGWVKSTLPDVCKSADGPIGPDGLAVTLAAVIPFAELHNYELRLQRLFEAAANDLLAALPEGHGSAPLRLLVPSWLIGSSIGERLTV